MTDSRKKLLTVGGGSGLVVVIAVVIILNRGAPGSASQSSSNAYFAGDRSDNPQRSVDGSVAQRGEGTGEERGRSSRLSGSAAATDEDDANEVLGENKKKKKGKRRNRRRKSRSNSDEDTEQEAKPVPLKPSNKALRGP